MKNYKKSYFQGGGGVNEPTPGKKKYKSEKAIIVQPRFKEPFAKNYDLYDVDGEHGPGSGWNHMHEYKSILEFLKSKRKYKDKFKAEDSYTKARINLLNRIIKTAIDFPTDEYIDPGIAVGTESDNPLGGSGYISGYLDKTLTKDDFEDKSPTVLNFGRDYVEDCEVNSKTLQELIGKYLQPAEPALYGLPNGIDPKEDLDSDKVIKPKKLQYSGSKF